RSPPAVSTASATPGARPAPLSDTEYVLRACLKRLEFVDEQGFDEDRALGNQTSLEARSANQRTEQIEVGIGRHQEVDASARGEPLARLLEQRSDVAVVRAGMPWAAGKIAGLARKRR